MALRTPVKFGDIFIVRIQYGHCCDPRPCIVVTPPIQEQIEIMSLSSQMDMFQTGPHFKIDKHHPNFGATKLKRTCYANSNEKHFVSEHELGLFVGQLEGDLLKQFEKWYG